MKLVIIDIFMKVFRMLLLWEDKRYIEGNEENVTGCKFVNVEWTKSNQFWLPNFFVVNAIELARLL